MRRNGRNLSSLSPGRKGAGGDWSNTPAAHRLSLIIPTYNERENLPVLLERIDKALSGIGHQVVVVDDSSPDGTWEVASQAAAESGNVVLVKRPGKMGLASAFLEGLKQSDGELVGLMDADLQHPPELLPGLLKAIEEGADIAVASRFVRGGGVGEWSAPRRLVSWGARLLATLALPKTSGVRDTMSGYFVMKREVIAGLSMSSSGFKVLLEVLAKGEYGKVAEVPYVFEPRRKGHSKLGSGEIWNYIRHLVRLSLETRGYLTFVRFCLVGLSGVVVNEAVFWALATRLGIYFVLAGGISAEAAIVNNFIWNDYWTFREKALGTPRSRLARFAIFNVNMAGGVLISLVVLYLLATLLGINYLISNLGAIIVSMLWNYAASTKFVWA
jgi:dolichol-phosphate mannosyltransferase